MQDVVVADQFGQAVAGSFQAGFGARNQDVLDIFADFGAHRLFSGFFAARFGGRNEFVVLGRYYDRMHALRFVVVAVFDRNLALGVGSQVGHHLAFAADGGQFLQDYVRQDQRGGHQLLGLRAGVTEHDSLVAGALFLFGLAYDALVDIGRLFVDRRQHAARIAVETVIGVRIADPVDHAARDVLYVHVRFRTDFTGHDDQPRGAERFAGYFRIGIVTKKFVEDCIGNLIRNLVGMSFGHRFGGK